MAFASVGMPNSCSKPTEKRSGFARFHPGFALNGSWLALGAELMSFASVCDKNQLEFELVCCVNGEEREEEEEEWRRERDLSGGVAGSQGKKRRGVSCKSPKYPSLTLFLCPKLMHIQYR